MHQTDISFPKSVQFRPLKVEEIRVDILMMNVVSDMNGRGADMRIRKLDNSDLKRL